MKKFYKAICAVLTASLLSGCVPHTELDEKAIVLAVGIDYEDGLFKTSFQYYSPSGVGSKTLVDSSQPNVFTAKGEGENVYGALEDASFRCGRELMLGVMQIIIIGEEAAKTSVGTIVNFTKSYFQGHPDMLVTVSEGNACDYMQVKFKEGIVSTQRLTYLTQNAERNGIICIPTALELFISLETAQKCICLPRLRLLEGEKRTDASEDEKNIEISGGVLIKDGKAIGDLDTEVMSGLEMLCCKTEKGTVTIDYNDEKISVGLEDIVTKIKPKSEDGVLVFDVSVSSQGKYLIPPHESDEEDNSEVGRLCAEQLIARMSRAIEETVSKYGADPCSLEKIIRHYDNGLWNSIRDNYEETLKNSRFDFNVNINIDKLILSK